MGTEMKEQDRKMVITLKTFYGLEEVLKEELEEFGKKHKLYDLSTIFEEDFFETKKVLYVPM